MNASAAVLRAVLSRQPATPAQDSRRADAAFEVSRAAQRQGRQLDAMHLARACVALAPDHALFRAHAAQLHVAYGLSGEALAFLDPLEIQHLHDAALLNAAGSVLSLAGHSARAQAWFERAAALEPGRFRYRYNAAQGYVHMGDIARARHEFNGMLRQWPAHAKLHWSIAALGGVGSDRNQLEAMEQALRLCDPAGGEAVLLQHALFLEYDALDERERAWPALEQGMRAQRAKLRHDPAAEAALVRALATAAQSMPPASTQAACDEPGTIFVLGLPRSGTTVIERMLGNHPDVASAGELLDFAAVLREQLGLQTTELVPATLPARLANADLGRAGQHYLDSSAHHRANARVHTDKLPFNYLLVPWILQALPNARILHLVRCPMDTCFSNLKLLFSDNYRACNDQIEMADNYARYRFLMAQWQRLFPDRILDVSYEALVAEPEMRSREILSFCRLPARPGISAIESNVQPVASASCVQVRDPISARSVGAWRRYEAQLQPLLQRLRVHGIRPH